MAKPKLTRRIGYIVSGTACGKRKQYSGYIDSKKDAMVLIRGIKKRNSKDRCGGIIKNLSVKKVTRPRRLGLVDSRFGG